MNKKLSRILTGTLSVMFIGQVLIYGDGSSQGIAHAETIAGIKESLQLSENADAMQQEYENAVDGLGEVEYFESPESEIMMMNETAESEEITFAEGLIITGKVEKGGQKTADDTPIFVRIFNGDWAELNSVELADGGSFSVEASGLDVYHVKFECDGYLPFYLKDFGTGKYQVGSGESWDTIILIPGDTTWNEGNDNQWSDDVLNAADSAYVRSCLGAYRGDSDFNPCMDTNRNGQISYNEKTNFLKFYTDLGDEQIDISGMSASNYDINNDGKKYGLRKNQRRNQKNKRILCKRTACKTDRCSWKHHKI